MKKTLLALALGLAAFTGAWAGTDGQTYEPVNGIKIANQWIFDRVHSGSAYTSNPICNTYARTATMIGDVVYVGRSNENLAMLDSLPQTLGRQLLLDRDSHGNVQLSLIDTEKLISQLVGQEITKINVRLKKENQIPFSTQLHFFGYEGRCAAPSNFDADYCYALGYNATKLIACGVTGYMSSVRNLTAPSSQWLAGGTPITMMLNIEMRNGVPKPVIRKALVDLEGRPFKDFAEQRETWAMNTCYVYPGPIQYFGPTEVCDQPSRTLQLEQNP